MNDVEYEYMSMDFNYWVGYVIDRGIYYNLIIFNIMNKVLLCRKWLKEIINCEFGEILIYLNCL